MAAWLELARQSLRPHARRTHAWRARTAFALLFGVTGAWAAAAPQASVGLGERLRMSFHAISALGLLIAAAAGLRYRAQIFETDLLAANHRRFGKLANHLAQSLQDLLPAFPFIFFLIAVQAISPAEAARLGCMIVFLLTVSLAFRHEAAFAILLCYALRGRNAFEISLGFLFAAHLCIKGWVTWKALRLTHDGRFNLMHESVTPLSVEELCATRRLELRKRISLQVGALLALNLALLLAMILGAPLPLTFEHKVALALILIAGAGLLILDVSALTWQGLLAGLRTENMSRSFTLIFSSVIVAPWAGAWSLYALHAGEAFTLNECAAYFFLWVALGGATSWAARVSAKEKLHRELRHLLSEG